MKAPARIFTSIVPHGPERQSAAVEQWHALGYEVHSVNSVSEARRVDEQFPYVYVHESPRDAMSIWGRAYAFVDDVLTIAEWVTNDDEPICLVNSDIYLDGRLDDLEWAAIPHGSGVIGTRINVSTLSSPFGLNYDVGFDLFVFPSGALRQVSFGTLCLGVPFWDFALPLLLARMGHALVYLGEPVLLHVWHAERYSRKVLNLAAFEFTRVLKLNGVPVGLASATEVETSDISDEELMLDLVLPSLRAIHSLLESSDCLMSKDRKETRRSLKFRASDAYGIRVTDSERASGLDFYHPLYSLYPELLWSLGNLMQTELRRSARARVHKGTLTTLGGVQP
ncbi:unannotated protein [freshwater metagenome]|uniref:Unannotated protein n=1 Tax=freshwater metagenome TaxID=449393 RepID=A0A6J7KIY6_9ZZZZ